MLCSKSFETQKVREISEKEAGELLIIFPQSLKLSVVSKLCFSPSFTVPQTRYKSLLSYNY